MTNCRQTGHSESCRPHFTQDNMCPHSSRTQSTGSSIHILHKNSFSASIKTDRRKERNVKVKNEDFTDISGDFVFKSFCFFSCFPQPLHSLLQLLLLNTSFVINAVSLEYYLEDFNWEQINFAFAFEISDIGYKPGNKRLGMEKDKNTHPYQC